MDCVTETEFCRQISTDTIQGAILTCEQKLTQVSLIYRTGPKLESGK